MDVSYPFELPRLDLAAACVVISPPFQAFFKEGRLQTSNVKRQTPNVKRQTPNAKRQTSNVKRQTSNLKPQTTN
jgi:hypothetical protein